MILWVMLFALVVALSFVLAAQSMRDFVDLPVLEEYSLFLIRNTKGLDASVISAIHQGLAGSLGIFSFERLFKGKQSVLVVFGPKDFIAQILSFLDPLELEDYTNVEGARVSAWEVGIKGGERSSGPFEESGMTNGSVFHNMPALEDTEQFWWQVIVSGEFKPQIRAILIAEKQKKFNLEDERLVKLPKAFSNAQLLDFYQKRISKGDSQNPTLAPEELLPLILLS